MNATTLTTQAHVRAAFWRAHYWDVPPSIRVQSPVRSWTQNDYNTDTRCAFVDFIDHLARSGQITEALAQRVTL